MRKDRFHEQNRTLHFINIWFFSMFEKDTSYPNSFISRDLELLCILKVDDCPKPHLERGFLFWIWSKYYQV